MFVRFRIALVAALIMGLIGITVLVKLVGIEQRLASLEASAPEHGATQGNVSAERPFAAKSDTRRYDWRPPSVAKSKPIASPEADYQATLAKFNHEQSNPAWAGTTRQNLEDALLLASQKGAAPQGVEIDCRSKSCRMEMSVADTGEADLLLEPLLTEMAGFLPSTKIIQTTSPDGRLRLHMFATLTPPSILIAPPGR